MLLISKEQMNALDAAMGERFIQKMLEHLRDVFSEEITEKTDEDIRAVIVDGMMKASAYNITEEQAVALFIDLRVGMGQDFELKKGNEWMLSIVEKEDLSGQEKMDLLYARLQD